MNINEYLVLSEKTMSQAFYCEEKEQRLLHAIIGALTEVEELLENYKEGVLTVDVTKQGSVAEESADIFWYLAIVLREFEMECDIPTNSIYAENTNPFNMLLDFTKSSLKLLDVLKKKIYYNKPIMDVFFQEDTVKLFNILSSYCLAHNVVIEDILDKNIAKLKARYGDKFSTDKAINRDLEVEKNILEK